MKNDAKKTLVLGGVRSGKSAIAEQLAMDSGLRVIYVATSQIDSNDQAMQDRVKRHTLRRPNEWQLVEEPLHLGDVIRRYQDSNTCILIDCLTLWVTNLLMLDDSGELERQKQHLLKALKESSLQVVMVSNESNMGVTPMGELSRRYCDEIGLLHQQVAASCDCVVFTVAGLPHVLKGDLSL